MTRQFSETNTGAAHTLRHVLGFASVSPFPYSLGPTSLRLRRLRDQRAQESVQAPIRLTAARSA